MLDEENMDVSAYNRQISEMSEKLEKSLSMDTTDKMDTCHRYIKDAKNAARQGDMSKALELFKLAHKIHPSEKLKSRINKIEELIAQQDSESDGEDFVNINNSGLMLFRELHDKLYEHQRVGVSFMYSLYRDGLKGGILADDMGLGKTIQVIAFLSGMYDAELVKHTLLVMPTSLITTWTKEFIKWTPGMRVKEFHGTSKVERSRNLEKVQRRGGVVITTYQMLIQNWQQLASHNAQEFKWDYMILDEAHKIKTTSTKTAKSAYAIPARNRVLLTGTPVQNNLREMWALFDFACQGALLGTSKTFKTEYENPITRAREKDATPGEKVLGLKMSENLMNIINPYFLRRTKADVQKKRSHTCKENHSGSDSGDNQVANTEKQNGAIMPELKRKNDLIVWTYLSAVQEDIYRQFLSLDHIKELLTTTRSPLAELNVLKKLCDHPRLLSAAAVAHLGLEGHTPESQSEDGEGAAHSLDNIPDDTLISESGKMVFLITLLERLRMEGHRTLVFAHYRKVLDIIEQVLGNRGFKTMRLDGTITQLAERERRICRFQTDKRYSVFLLTTMVGGVGITLTAANRVVIYDPSWNPATDAQAVDRACRIGQTENVVIYRLITCGTVEEKIYRRQVFKDSLIRQTTGDKKNPFRYFSKQELKELFTLEETRSSSTQLQLQSLHSSHRRTDPELDEHIAHLHSMDMFGISDHDLMFSLDVNHHDEHPEDQQAQQYIEGRVRKAQELMKAESELQVQLAENMESSTEPAWLRQPDQQDKERSHGKQRKTDKPSPRIVHLEDDSNELPITIELDQSSKEDNERNIKNGFIDLTIDENMTEEQPDLSPEATESNQNLPIQQSLMMEQTAAEAENISVQELMEMSTDIKSADTAAECNTSHGFTSTAFNGQKLQNVDSLSTLVNSEDQSTAIEEEQHLEPPQGNFNLQLEDSENANYTDQDTVDEQEVEAQEIKLLSQLKMEGSFNVNKSLAEFKQERVSELDQSGDDSIIVTKKKRAAVLYDSEEEDDEGLQMMSSQFSDSFQVASTPKSLHSVLTPLRARKSIGGNVSVASRQSLVESIDENDLHDDEEEEEEERLSENGSGDYQDISEHSGERLELDETKGETLHTEDEVDSEDEKISDISEHSGERLELDETKGETLHTEDEVDSEDERISDISEHSGERLELDETKGETLHTDDEADSENEKKAGSESGLEESTTDPESVSDPGSNGSDASSSGLDPTTNVSSSLTNGCNQTRENVLAHPGTDTVEPQSDSEDSYEVLVQRGKQCYSEGKLQDALSFFLKAIDISSGDTEVQLLVIQLYRKMSEKT